MKTRYLFLFLALSLVGCTVEEETTDLATAALIPMPTSITADGKSFTVPKKFSLSYEGESEELSVLAIQISRLLQQATGKEVAMLSPGSTGSIHLELDPEAPIQKEGYELAIERKNIKIKAASESGIFYGIQTLLQLFPTSKSGQLKIPTGTITDAAQFEHRGTMLDVSRHFFGVEDVKQVIDYMAMYKLNRLHLHLSDDQGWRIEIKSWPNLTEYGSKSEVGDGEGGFYTQEEYKSIVDYAAQRFITIIPEIDIPGHTNAALASYPELNCNGKAPDRYRGTEVGFSTLCVNKDITYKFVDDVVRELATITPGPYIHIGGDESEATSKKDYLAFIPRVNEIVKKHGKTMMGWDEISQTNLSSDAIIHHWVHTDFSQAAAKRGNKILLSPSNKIYLDMKYDSLTRIGYTWAAIINTKTAYDWDPKTLIPGIGEDNILGIEAPLWTETVLNMDDIEYMLFPRLPGVAEKAWSTDLYPWEDYRVRLSGHKPRWEAMDINYYPSPLID